MKALALGMVVWLAFAAQTPPPNTARWVAFDANFVRTEPGMRKVVILLA